jgi:hypothetical protein
MSSMSRRVSTMGYIGVLVVWFGWREYGGLVRTLWWFYYILFFWDDALALVMSKDRSVFCFMLLRVRFLIL